MKELTDWLGRQADREQRAVSLEDALLGNRFWAYARFRLRFFFARYLSTSVVQATRFVLLFSLFSRRDFIAILRVYAAAGLVASFWWGGLEVMRGRVRSLRRAGKPHLIPREIGRWLSLSTRLAAITLIGTLGWLFWRIASRGRAFGPADLYTLAILVRVSIGFVTRCYHSGIYALRRIYRPLPALVAVDAVSLVGLLVLWPWLGPWSFPVSSILSTVVVSALTIRYSARTYRMFGFRPSEHVDLRARPRAVRGSGRELVAAGISYAVMRLDALLVLTLFRPGPASASDTVLFVLFFALIPTVRAGFEWAHLLYFDLKRLELPLFRNLKRRFERHLFQLAVFMGIVFWGLGVLTAAAVYRVSLGSLLLPLVPFFLSRSLLAVAQIRAYAAREYGMLLASGAVCLIGFLGIGALPWDPGPKVLLATGVMAAALLGLIVASGRSGARTQSGEPLWLSDWLARVGNQREPVRIFAVRLEVGRYRRQRDDRRATEDAEHWKHLQVADQVARRLGRAGAATAVYPSRVLWFERGGGSPRVRPEWVVALGGGLVGAIQETGVKGDGTAALGAARSLDLLGNGVRRNGALTEGGPGTTDDVAGTFARTFPNGILYRSDAELPEPLLGLSSEERRSVLSDASAFARDFRPRASRSRYDVTALAERGELRMMFLVDRRADREARKRWRTAVRRLNLDLAVDREPGLRGRDSNSQPTD